MISHKRFLSKINCDSFINSVMVVDSVKNFINYCFKFNLNRFIKSAINSQLFQKLSLRSGNISLFALKNSKFFNVIFSYLFFSEELYETLQTDNLFFNMNFVDSFLMG